MSRTASFIIPLILYRLFALESRIDYLDVIPIEEAPFIVLVLCNNSKYFCTGTLIQEQHVLTSASCFYDGTGGVTEGDSTVLVVSGTNKLSLVEKHITSGHAQIRQSTSVRVHDSYYFSENFSADIALIKLDEPFNITERTRTAPLSPGRHLKVSGILSHDEEDARDFFNFKCSLYGFGKVYLKDDTRDDNALKRQTVTVGKSCTCLNKVWSLQWRSKVTTQSYICKQDDTDLTGLCSGDTGGPLICDNFLRGIGTNTFHYTDKDDCLLKKDGPNECGSRLSMSLFTDLCYYSQWLNWYVPEYTVVSDTCYPFGGLL